MSAQTVSKLTQYVIIRGDLLSSLGWPIGAVIAQACHASSAALWIFREDKNTIAYTNDLDCMHKVVLEVSTAVIDKKNIYYLVKRLNNLFSYVPLPRKLCFC